MKVYMSGTGGKVGPKQTLNYLNNKKTFIYSTTECYKSGGLHSASVIASPLG